MNKQARWLVILQTMFLGRVLGQVWVVLIEPSWLPPIDRWYSGLLPYYLLLPAQILLLMLMSLVSYDALRQQGFWHVQKASTKKVLRVLALVYFLIMVSRYALTMAFVPELRWFGHAIPIFFHFVLAGYLLVLGLPVPRPVASAAPSSSCKPGRLSSQN